MKYALDHRLSPTFLECRGMMAGRIVTLIRKTFCDEYYFSTRHGLFALEIYERQFEGNFLVKFGYNKSRNNSR